MLSKKQTKIIAIVWVVVYSVSTIIAYALCCFFNTSKPAPVTTPYKEIIVPEPDGDVIHLRIELIDTTKAKTKR